MRPLTIPDLFLDHDTPANQYARAGLTAPDIAATALCALGREDEVVPARA